MNRQRSTCVVAGLFVFAIFIAYGSGAVAAATQEITFSDMLFRMADLEWLARVPAPGERSAQFSSYDRASTNFLGFKVNWFANEDWGHFIDVRTINGRREAVLAHIDGPGAIVRIWSANPRGILRLYLDDDAVPAVQVPFETAVQGTWDAPFVEPFTGVRARGANIYFPFTFQQRAVVTVENPGDMYYHVNYVQFPPDTQVEVFSAQLVHAHRNEVEQVANRLSNPYATHSAADSHIDELNIRLQPGEKKTVRLNGPAAITQLQWQVEALDLDRALRDVLLTATWDGLPRPSIWSPIGDFFGGSPGLNAFESLPLGILTDGTMYSHWYMPFARTAHLEFINEGNQTVEINGIVGHRPIQWDDGLSYFHAKWRKDPKLTTHRDWPVLDAYGPGRFVGLMLSLMNPVRQWWGEGDEKIYVDGEAFPSTFGTGTEDYFGYAWSSPQLFYHAYHNQSRADGPGNFGRIVNSRFHVIDNILFHERLRFDMEIWHWVSEAVMSYSAVAYWYSQSNTDSFAPVPVARRAVVEAPVWRLYEVEGALEGEKLRLIAVDRGVADPQDMGFFTDDTRLWSNESQLWWRQGRPGDRLTVAVPVAEAGVYRLIGAFTKAPDYGIVQLFIDGTPVGGPMDFYDSSVVPTGEIEIGSVFLPRGAARFTFQIVGANARATDYMFGLDYLLLQPAATP